MRLLKIGLLLATILIPVAAQAVPSLIVTRAGLGANDFIDWGVLGVPGTTVNDPFNILSNSGAVTATVTNPTGNFFRFNQNNGWNGNFAPGDALLFTNFTAGPIDINFNIPVFGAGAQIQQNTFGAFTGTIDIFAADDTTLLASFSLPGNSNSAGDNSAIFLGGLDTSATIGRIVLDIAGTNDFAINRLSLVTTAAVPEPSTLLLLVAGLLGIRASQFGRKK